MQHSLLVNLSFLMLRPTGTSTYALNVVSQLQSLSPTLLTPRPIDSFCCHFVPPNQTAEQGIRGHLRRLAWTQFQLPKIYRDLQSNLVFSPIPEAPLFSGCRYIVTVHDLIPLRFPGQFSPLTLYCRHYLPRILERAEHILCVSEATAQDITHFCKIPAHKITPILLAYDAENFRFLDLPTRPYFLCLGRTEPYKNLQRLIAAFANLANNSDYELWLAGPADQRYRPSLIAQVEALGLRARVQFLDYVPYAELPTLLGQATALVLPSLWEGFGLPVLEAMACGTPVITANLASLPEVADNAALLVDPYNTAAITEALKAVATDSNLRRHLRACGLVRASQFSWAKTGRATAEVIARHL